MLRTLSLLNLLGSPILSCVRRPRNVSFLVSISDDVIDSLIIVSDRLFLRSNDCGVNAKNFEFCI